MKSSQITIVTTKKIRASTTKIFVANMKKIIVTTKFIYIYIYNDKLEISVIKFPSVEPYFLAPNPRRSPINVRNRTIN